ncbi:MAG: lytic murein transglycosylase, partial [Hyphomicrobiaceae bacterium]
MTHQARRAARSISLACVMLIMTAACPVAVRAVESFATWRDKFRDTAIAFGIRPAVYDQALRDVTPDERLPDLAIRRPPQKRPRGQAEFSRPPQAYLDKRLLARLAQTGRQMATKYRSDLNQIERELGVSAYAVLAIWGRETAFGGYKLPHNAIRVLATQAYIGRRSRVFRRELLYALKLIQDGIATKSQLRSSWAGAIGLTQFMPSEYQDLAYDLNRDGRKDIWAAADALASAANQLRQKGWERGKTWGFEVKLPAGVSCAMDGPHDARSIRAWSQLGVKRARRRAFPERYLDDVAFLLTPAGGLGPAFLVLENFMIFKRYNPSDLYALFVGHLADRISGGGDFEEPWRNVRQLRSGSIAEIQRHLQAGGYAISKIDGKIGA